MTSVGKFSWCKYIELSQQINESYQDENEARARCGISRAYYGAFHVVIDYMKEQDIFQNDLGEGSHQKVIGDCVQFSKSANKDAGRLWGKLAEGLKRLKNMRVQADYKDYYWKDNRQVLHMKPELQKAVGCAEKLQGEVCDLREAERR